jgi:hypothetical protein
LESIENGNIEYLLNISAIKTLFCLFIFILVKLFAIWHSAGREISCHCGADAAQFRFIEGGIGNVLFCFAALALVVLLPLNLPT